MIKQNTQMIYLIIGEHYICQVKGQQWQETDITAGEREIQNIKSKYSKESKSDQKKYFLFLKFNHKQNNYY